MFLFFPVFNAHILLDGPTGLRCVPVKCLFIVSDERGHLSRVSLSALGVWGWVIKSFRTHVRTRGISATFYKIFSLVNSISLESSPSGKAIGASICVAQRLGAPFKHPTKGLECSNLLPLSSFLYPILIDVLAVRRVFIKHGGAFAWR